MTDFVNFVTVGVTASVAIGSVVITSVLSRRREREADWRKLKLSQYQEFVLALSGVVRERVTRDGQRRYADAVNSLALVAPEKILKALQAFQNEISYINTGRSDERHDKLLDALLRAMRADIHPGAANIDPVYRLHILGLPPEGNVDIYSLD